MNNLIKKWTRKGLAIMLTLLLMSPMFLVQADAYSVDYTLPENQLPSLTLGEAPDSTTGAAFFNTAGDEGEHWISMTDARSFEAIIPVNMTQEDAEAVVSEGAIKWTLSRTEPYLNRELYPNYKKGGDLTSWEGRNDLFTNIKTSVYKNSDTVCLKVTFDCAPFYYDKSIPHGSATRTMDYIGWYSLAAQNEGETLGSVAAKIVPYDHFRTMGEVYDEIDELASYNSDYYVERFSMGKSQVGYDMPYLIVAKNKAAVDNWLSLCERAETEPDKVLAELNDETLSDYQVPVMFSNVHANETSSTDSILDFAEMLVKNGTIEYNDLESFTTEGNDQLEIEMGPKGEENSVAIPDLVKDSSTYLGYLKAGNNISGKVDLKKYYNIDTKTVDVSAMLEDVFYILVPEENVEGRIYMSRESSGGLDLNRDNSFQTQNETQNMTRLIGKYNPVALVELHGRIKSWQIEPCTPPHEPNFEYDLLAKHLMSGGEAFGTAAVANNNDYNSYTTPQRDYLLYTGNKLPDGSDETYWEDPWDDMSTSYTPQFAMLHGCVSYTVEQPAYNGEASKGSAYGQLGLSDYVAANKDDIFKAQLETYKRGVTNANSNAYDLVGQWYCDQYDVEGAEADIFRPEYDGPGENGNFYPECYIIPLDQNHQTNLQAANDMMKWLTRNDVKILFTEKAFTYKGQTYPAGTMIVTMYQAKRSVANGALYGGIFIDGWSVLYSEGITSFNETRGFDMAVCAEPDSYENIESICGEMKDYEDCLSYLSKATSSLAAKNYSGFQVIISNASEDSTAAVNTLLQKGKTVGMITEGKYQGDYICSYDDWLLVCNDFILSGTCVRNSYPTAKIITKSPVIYINGIPGESNFGYINTPKITWNSYKYNYDRQGMDLMNFKTTKNVSEADIIIGASSMDTAALKAVQKGIPYIGYGSSVSPETFFDTMDRSSTGGMDAMPYVTYPDVNLINASYVANGDDVMYGYGAGYYNSVPSGAAILVQVDANRKPTEGFMPASNATEVAEFMNGSIQGFSYKGEDKGGNDINVALFANTLTNKVHQRDEYAFISNFAFSNMLGDEYTASEYKPSHGHSGSGSKPTPVTPMDPVTPEIGDGLTSKQAAQLAANTFNDVKENAWYAESVGRMMNSGLMKGTTTTTFAPGALFDRGMIAAVVYRLAGSPTVTGSNPFSDVSEGAWYHDAVVWGASTGIIAGYDGRYGSGDPITREQVVAILYRYAVSTGKDVTAKSSLDRFTDSNEVSGFASEAMNWAVANGIISGSTNATLNPKATATRAEVAAMLVRAIDLLQE